MESNSSGPQADIIVLNQSSLKDYLNCQRLFGWKQIEGLEPVGRRSALEIGSATHHGLALLHSGRSVAEAQKEAADYLKRRGGPSSTFLEKSVEEAREITDSLLSAYAAYWGSKNEMWKPLNQEIEFLVEVGEGTNIYIRGKTDNLSVAHGSLYLVDYKTAAKMDPRDLLKYEMDIQLSTYLYGLSKFLTEMAFAEGRTEPVKVEGAIIDVLVKTKIPQFARELFTRTDEELDEFEAEFLEYGRRIREQKRRVAAGENWKIVFPKNTENCLAAGTGVFTLRGPEPIESLSVGRWVWGWQNDMWKPSQILAVMDQGLQKVFRITLRDRLGRLTAVDATANHRFLRRDGTYAEVHSLRPGDRLMPSVLRRARYGKSKKEYWDVSLMNSAGPRTLAHRVVAAYFGVLDEVVHHIDGNGLNNDPDNLRGLSLSDHSASPIRQYSQEERILRAEAGRRRWSELSPEQYQDACQEITDRWQRYYRNRTPEQEEEHRKKLSEAAKRRWQNHFIVSIEPIGEAFTWDIQTSTENFALEAGVFVHNCFRYGTCAMRDLCLKDTPARRAMYDKREANYVDLAAAELEAYAEDRRRHG